MNIRTCMPILSGYWPNFWTEPSSTFKLCVCEQQRFWWDCLFDLILYVPVNKISVMSGRVFLVWTSIKQGLMCHAQGHNAVAQVRLEPATPQSQDKHSTTVLPLLRLCKCAGSPELLLLAYVFSTKISWTSSYIVGNLRTLTSVWLRMQLAHPL